MTSNFVVMAMELLEWSSYYNTSYSNPYNQPTFLHLGMPKSFSKEYQAAMSRNTDSCNARITYKYIDQNAFEGSKNYENQRLDLNTYCNEIGCIWRSDCDRYHRDSHAIKTLDDADFRYMAESIIGFAIENNHEDWVIDEYSLIMNPNYESDDKDNLITNWYDACTLMAIKYSNVHLKTFIVGLALLDDMYYWGKEEKVIPQDKDVLTREQVKEQMLQWATERSTR